MTERPVSVKQTLCQIDEINDRLATTPCDRWGQPAARLTTATRTAIELALDQPVLLPLTVRGPHGWVCRPYFRVQPPFVRPAARDPNRLVRQAVPSVDQASMAFQRVASRLARDVWVQPSEQMIRQGGRSYRAPFAFEPD